MPTYEYRCPSGHEFEKFYRKISDAGAEVPCPQCGQTADRLISAGAGLVFKGSGFYITDYGKDGKKDQPSAARSKARGESGGDAASAGGDSASGGPAGTDAKSSTEAKPASAEGKPAATKDSAKADAAPAKPAKADKPSKPSTE